MDKLKDRIVRDGVAIGTEILKVDTFLNHQIDVDLFEEMGAEFRRRFGDVADRVDKILTVEASGIAVAAFTARAFGGVPVVFAKKEKPSTMDDEYYFSEVMSFTKRKLSAIRVAKKFLSAGDRCLIIDDFLAHGQAALGLLHICGQAGAEVLGCGIVIEKAFQGGGAKLREKGVRVESLAVVASIESGVIHFGDAAAPDAPAPGTPAP
ncbi:MAG: xanthine phosphoribosyltransferase [Clostridiales Family XIII bacterium]|jgi:xanthine phosphoribosyltransferase|nr:xanthine phosphoribosyltransferase [Clostridiales Family XIII bacterium]